MQQEKTYKCCLLVDSTSSEKIFRAIGISNVVLEKGGEVHILFGNSLLQWLIKNKTDKQDADVLERLVEKVQETKKMGKLKIYACPSSSNIAYNELSNIIDARMNLVGFIDLAMNADMTLYI